MQLVKQSRAAQRLLIETLARRGSGIVSIGTPSRHHLLGQLGVDSIVIPGQAQLFEHGRAQQLATRTHRLAHLHGRRHPRVEDRPPISASGCIVSVLEGIRTVLSVSGDGGRQRLNAQSIACRLVNDSRETGYRLRVDTGEPTTMTVIGHA